MSKTFPVQTNKAYLIESDQDATVTSVDGVSIAKVEEDRGQVTVVAPVNELVVSNDDAKVQTLIKKVQVLVNGQIRYAEIDGDNSFTGNNAFAGNNSFTGTNIFTGATTFTGSNPVTFSTNIYMTTGTKIYFLKQSNENTWVSASAMSWTSSGTLIQLGSDSSAVSLSLMSGNYVALYGASRAYLASTGYLFGAGNIIETTATEVGIYAGGRNNQYARLKQNAGGTYDFAVNATTSAFNGTVDFTNANVVGLETSDVSAGGNNTFTGTNNFTGNVTFSGTVSGLPEGPKGDPGPQGEPGESAYQIWLNEGNSGTKADFLASLKGEKGDTGDTGPQGNPGTDGATGPQGEPGRSAYEIAVEKGYTGTEDDWATVQMNAAQNATDAANSAAVAETYAKEAANSALSATGLPLSYHLSRLAKTDAEWEAIATRIAGCIADGGQTEKRQDRLLKIRQGALCYPQYTTNGTWLFGNTWYGDSNSNFDTTTWEIVIDASSITTASVFLFNSFTGAFRRVFIFAPNMIQNQGSSMSSMNWTHELDGVFTKLTTPGDMFADKARTHIMPWCAGKTIESLVNINNFMKNNVALPADQFPIGLPNVTNAQDAFLNCPLLTQEVADAILNSLPAVEAGTNGKGTITFTGTAASTSWRAEGADLTAVNAATEKGWTVEY